MMINGEFIETAFTADEVERAIAEEKRLGIQDAPCTFLKEKQLDTSPLTPSEFEKAIMYDDGLAAQQHLDAGRPIYYSEAKYPEGLVKKYPDNRKQLITFDDNDEELVIRAL